MTDQPINLSLDLEERRNGWVFRFPAGDDAALWRGPFPTEQAATEAGIAAIEEFMTYHVADMLGLSN